MTENLPGIEPDAVTRWLRDHIDALEAPLDYSLIAAGGSNLTYRDVDGADRSWALRRPPATAVLATAHDVVREYRILDALARDGTVPVPAAIALCEDVDVTGAPFSVMEFVDGTILRTETDALALTTSQAEAATDSLIDVQVVMHTLDPDTVGLSDLSRHRSGYLERQLARWRKQVDTARVRATPVLDDLHERLSRTVPTETGAPTIVHGDYRFDNTVLGHDDRVIAVLDWELCTIGDAVADFVWSLLYWADPGDEIGFLESAPTLAPVFCRRTEVAARYAARSGRGLDALPWLVTFSYWKMACIVEGVYVRRLKGARGGAAETPDVARIAARVDGLLDHARETAAGIL
ncbi:MAG: phosphotransferase family protein [Acidimicrobiia bacterium]